MSRLVIAVPSDLLPLPGIRLPAAVFLLCLHRFTLAGRPSLQPLEFLHGFRSIDAPAVMITFRLQDTLAFEVANRGCRNVGSLC